MWLSASYSSLRGRKNYVLWILDGKSGVKTVWSDVKTVWSDIKTVWGDVKTVWSDVIDGVEWCDRRCGVV